MDARADARYSVQLPKRYRITDRAWVTEPPYGVRQRMSHAGTVVLAVGKSIRCSGRSSITPMIVPSEPSLQAQSSIKPIPGFSGRREAWRRSTEVRVILINGQRQTRPREICCWKE